MAETHRSSGRAGRAGWSRLLAAGVAVTYSLVVLGGVVRITGSGLGCGDDWPLCHGRLIPPLDLPTLIEYTHRLVAVLVSVLVCVLVAWAWKPGRGAAWARERRLSLVALGLLLLQVLLGAVTVWLELPPASVVLHLGTAMLLLGTLVATYSAAVLDHARRASIGDRACRVSWALAGASLVVVLMGALVANLGAAPACQGFPLCNGRWLPGPDLRVRLHWAHRLAAYVLVFGLVFLPSWVKRARWGDRAAVRTAWLATAVGGLQVAVAAAMVLRLLPTALRAAHLAVGAALFTVLVVHAWLVQHPSSGRAAAHTASRSAT
ncbi:MAG: heme A synthase [Gemmatimonadota bacterium]